MKVKILRGLPGSGKSTYTKGFSAVVCSADQYFMRCGVYSFNPKDLGKAHGECLKNFIRACQTGKELIFVDNTNITVLEMAPYVSIAMAYGYEIEILAFKVPVETSINRNVHNVPAETIKRMARSWQDNFPHYWPTQKLES